MERAGLIVAGMVLLSGVASGVPGFDDPTADTNSLHGSGLVRWVVESGGGKAVVTLRVGSAPASWASMATFAVAAATGEHHFYDWGQLNWGPAASVILRLNGASTHLSTGNTELLPCQVPCVGELSSDVQLPAGRWVLVVLVGADQSVPLEVTLSLDAGVIVEETNAAVQFVRMQDMNGLGALHLAGVHHGLSTALGLEFHTHAHDRMFGVFAAPQSTYVDMGVTGPSGAMVGSSIYLMSAESPGFYSFWIAKRVSAGKNFEPYALLGDVKV